MYFNSDKFHGVVFTLVSYMSEKLIFIFHPKLVSSEILVSTCRFSSSFLKMQGGLCNIDHIQYISLSGSQFRPYLEVQMVFVYRFSYICHICSISSSIAQCPKLINQLIKHQYVNIYGLVEHWYFKVKYNT